MRRLNPTIIAILAGLALLLFLVWFFAGQRNVDKDRLSDTQIAANEVQPPDRSKRCGASGTFTLLKRELFRRAAALRGGDQAVYDKLAGYALLRMENPVMEGENPDTGLVSCSGFLSLDLPPGVALANGRGSLTANIDYTVQPSAGGDVVLVSSADSIIGPLATLTRTAGPATGGGAIGPQPSIAPPGPSTTVPPVQPPPTAGNAPGASPRPSFDCARAETRGEIAVCSDTGLATLDSNMAAQYRRAVGGASPAQRDLLESTRDRFLAYRDRCPTRACMADAYMGRMREIRDILEGRWRAPR